MNKVFKALEAIVDLLVQKVIQGVRGSASSVQPKGMLGVQGAKGGCGE